MAGSRYKTKFDFETTLRLYNDGVGRKYIPYWAPSPRDSAQYGIYFLPTSRHYKAVMSSQNRHLVYISYLLFSTVYLTFEQFVTNPSAERKKHLANVCLGVGSQVGYLGSKKFKVLPCEIFGIFCVINPSRSFG